MWRIDQDHVDGDEKFTSTDYKPSQDQQLETIFRLYDGDGNICYEGRMDKVSFAPLDDFGMGYAGCTELRYFEKGEWKTL